MRECWQMLIAFKQLMANPKYGGRYYSLTPGIPESISKEKYQVRCWLQCSFSGGCA
jgi:hypothetical protein